MTAYFLVKLVHILSATILFGTGLGTAFFMLRAYRSENAEAIRITNRTVVFADWLFTTPAVITQLATGLWLTSYAGIPYTSVWLVTVLVLFGIVGLCWLPVVWIQIHLRRLAESKPEGHTTTRYRRLMRLWLALGIPAFLCVVALFGLMVLRPMFTSMIG